MLTVDYLHLFLEGICILATIKTLEPLESMVIGSTKRIKQDVHQWSHRHGDTNHEVFRVSVLSLAGHAEVKVITTYTLVAIAHHGAIANVTDHVGVFSLGVKHALWNRKH